MYLHIHTSQLTNQTSQEWFPSDHFQKKTKKIFAFLLTVTFQKKASRGLGQFKLRKTLTFSPPKLLIRIQNTSTTKIFKRVAGIHSRRVVVSYKRKYVHKLLVNHLFKLAQEKVLLG